jgi:hypothetical protein
MRVEHARYIHAHDADMPAVPRLVLAAHDTGLPFDPYQGEGRARGSD